MKLSIIVNDSLTFGLAMNAAAVLGLSIGNQVPDLIGLPVRDREGFEYPGITRYSLPILRADNEVLRRILLTAKAECAGDTGGGAGGAVSVMLFTKTAQASRDYASYAVSMADESSDAFEISGLGLWGDAAAVKKLTGNLELYR